VSLTRGQAGQLRSVIWTACALGDQPNPDGNGNETDDGDDEKHDDGPTTCVRKAATP
jgi:hypothetical protein